MLDLVLSFVAGVMVASLALMCEARNYGNKMACLGFFVIGMLYMFVLSTL